MRRRDVLLGAPAVFALAADEKPAVLGGAPVRKAAFPSWPVVGQAEEDNIRSVVRNRLWNRNEMTRRFEETWAKALGARYCLATTNGTSSLYTALNALGVGPGDEVIVPPYTFVATINTVLMCHALPVFVDSDPATFQIDASKIEAAITPRTRCIMPVHLGGSPADLDTVLQVAGRRNIPVIEDACQAHFAEWRGKKVSTLGSFGAFSFQASKNLNCGEGGALLSNDEKLYETARSFHDAGRSHGLAPETYIMNGANLRMTDFQAAILLAQLTRLEQQSRVREANARYLTSLLSEIPGVAPARMYDGATRNAYHLYMFRYDPAKFAGLRRDTFLNALSAEGIPCSGGYTPLNREPFLESTFRSRTWKRLYSDSELRAWRERNECPRNDQLCAEAVWLTQNMLIGGREDMDQIAEAIRKIGRHAADLARG
jgi:dTDP-4-amino-4,6-dideoxygalactose transaminase